MTGNSQAMLPSGFAVMTNDDGKQTERCNVPTFHAVALTVIAGRPVAQTSRRTKSQQAEPSATAA
jgi:hypothetical protein